MRATGGGAADVAAAGGVIPIPKHADRAQVDRLMPVVEGRRCVVVGSAPLSTRYIARWSDEVVMAVNGGVSSVADFVDIWVVNSKAQDAPGALARPLHTTMLRQGSNRSVGHLLLLRGPKVASEPLTMKALKQQRCHWTSWSVLDKVTKRWLEGELCGRLDDKKPCSSGILTVAAVLWCGAASVRLEGFSFEPGYHYIRDKHQPPQSWWRDHVAADRRALKLLKTKFRDRLSGDLVQEAVAV